MCSGDLARLVQSFGNVLTNAAKYTDLRRRISLQRDVTTDAVTVEISDNGAGISPEFMPRIFDLFAQADRTLDRAEGGLGIGLSVVKKLVEMHGGASARAARGWAAAARSNHAAARRAARANARAGATRPCLRAASSIVDDNADAANSLSELLKMDGHETQPVFSAEEALSVRRRFRSRRRAARYRLAAHGWL